LKEPPAAGHGNAQFHVVRLRVERGSSTGSEQKQKTERTKARGEAPMALIARRLPTAGRKRLPGKK